MLDAFAESMGTPAFAADFLDVSCEDSNLAIL